MRKHKKMHTFSKKKAVVVGMSENSKKTFLWPKCLDGTRGRERGEVDVHMQK